MSSSGLRRLLLKRARLLVLAAVVGAIALAAGVASARVSAPTGGASSSKDISKLTWAIGATIRGLDFTQSSDSTSSTVISLGCETLVRYDRLGRLTPALASSFSTPNSRTYVYRIRRGVRFWDGRLLKPADVVYSLQQAAKKGSQISSFFTSVDSIRATGPSTVTIKLKEPDPFFRYSIAVTYVVQRKFWAAHQQNIGRPGVLTMCTGPFRFTRFVPDQEIDLKAFDRYWGGRPKVRTMSVKIIVSDPTRQLAMRSGSIDGAFRVPQDQIDQWKRLSNTRIQLAPELRTAYISFDVSAPPWNDVHVRRAAAYALDKRGLVRAVLRGYGSVAPTMPPPQQWGDLMSQAKVKSFYKSLPQYSYNLSKARAELRQSNFPNGFTATLPYPDSQQTLGKAALALSQSLKTIGVTLNVKQITTDEWFGALFGHKDLGAQIISWGVDYPDPADALHFIYDSQYATANAFNTANYKNARMDKELQAQQNSVRGNVRAAAIRRALRIGAVDVPYLPIWYQQIAMALNKKFTYNGFGTWYLFTPWAMNISAK
jgi:peptide/nickel transport system substrate-binding protein